MINSTPQNMGQKGLFYAEMNKQKIQKVQSPISNYKRFLTHHSEAKNNNGQNQVQIPQIIQRPKIHNYLTQNLPNKISQSDRKEKNSQDNLGKKTLSMKNIAAKSGHNSNENKNMLPMEDRMVYTARAGTNAFGSPRNTVDHSYGNQEHSLKFESEQQHYNKASSYLSSQKMTPNMYSMDQSSTSQRQSATDRRQSNTHFAGSRTLNSFFSQPSQIGFAVNSTPSNQPASMTNKIEESQH